MRKVTRNKKAKDGKISYQNVRRVKSVRKMTLPEALKLAIRNGQAMAEEIQKWIDINDEDTAGYVLAQHADGIYTHLYCDTEDNEPFPVAFPRLNSDLSGVIKSTMAEILLIKASVNLTTIQEGLELTILSTMFIQKDRRDTFLNSVKVYKDILKEERRV